MPTGIKGSVEFVLVPKEGFEPTLPSIGKRFLSWLSLVPFRAIAFAPRRPVVPFRDDAFEAKLRPQNVGLPGASVVCSSVYLILPKG